jgi:hypothetical protein
VLLSPSNADNLRKVKSVASNKLAGLGKGIREIARELGLPGPSPISRAIAGKVETSQEIRELVLEKYGIPLADWTIPADAPEQPKAPPQPPKSPLPDPDTLTSVEACRIFLRAVREDIDQAKSDGRHNVVAPLRSAELRAIERIREFEAAGDISDDRLRETEVWQDLMANFGRAFNGLADQYPEAAAWLAVQLAPTRSIPPPRPDIVRKQVTRTNIDTQLERVCVGRSRWAGIWSWVCLWLRDESYLHVDPEVLGYLLSRTNGLELPPNAEPLARQEYAKAKEILECIRR